MEFIIHKYKGTNYFKSDTFLIDKIIFRDIYTNGFPLFNYETEDLSEIAVYMGGEFDLTLSLLQKEKSINGKTIREYFLGEDRDFIYLINFFSGSQKFSGVARGSQISADYTETKNKLELRIVFKDIHQEWRDRCEGVGLNTLQINNGELLTFEQYVHRHFTGLTSGKVLIDYPTNKTYLQRLQPYHGIGGTPPAYAMFYGDFFNFITGKENISRWEVWKEFIKGIGCNFKMYVNGSSINELSNEPEYIFEIFFLEDLENETPEEIQVLEHREFTTGKRFDWLYLKYRSLIFDEIDYSSGLLFSENQYYVTDADNANNQLYPALLLRLKNKALSYDNGTSGEIDLVRDSDFAELELKQYNYNFSTGQPIGKLYSLNEADGGGMSYAQCMMCATANEPPPTQNIDKYNHIPVNRYASVNYQRYLSGLKKGKQFKVVFDENTNLHLWKTIAFDDGNGDEIYFISALRNIDLKNETAEIECIKL